jgi:Ser/Thr protein kinase RdoA (MazF antagonist)
VRCELFHRGVNDTFLLDTQAGRWVARVYRANIRTRAEIDYEVELLFHLHRSGVDVAVPVRSESGATVGAMALPEGNRPLVLFEHARGRPLSWSCPGHTLAAGELLAHVHAVADRFVASSPRTPLDLQHLVWGSLEVASSYIVVAEERDTLQRFAAKLDDAVSQAVSAGLDWGICHGDFGASNIHVSRAGVATVFDFDQCGPGWRVWDFVAPWSTSKYQRDESIWTTFIRGYQSVRAIGAADLAAAPLFHAVSRLWSLGMRARSASFRGACFLDDAYMAKLWRLCHEWQLDYIEANAASESR